MDFTPAEPSLACWRLAHTYSEFYPPHESAEECIEGLESDEEPLSKEGQDHEYWFHERKCEVYRAVIEYLYDRDVDVWERGRDHVQNGNHPEDAKDVLALPRRPATLDVIASESLDENAAMKSAIKMVRDRTLNADTIDDQLMWADALTDLTNASHGTISTWVDDQGARASERRA